MLTSHCGEVLRRWSRETGEESQCGVIRDLMLEAGRRGEWLTLGEIAARTDFGEASISAQLRHLRKLRFGRYCVEKRRRLDAENSASGRGGELMGCVWEYRVLPPTGVERTTEEGAPCRSA